MADKGILDPFSDFHVAALHHVFLPEKSELWRNAWSRHRIRTMKSSPLRVWVAGQLHNPVGVEDDIVDVEQIMVWKESFMMKEMRTVGQVFRCPIHSAIVVWNPLETKYCQVGTLSTME